MQEFKRIEQTIKHIYAKTGPYTSADISRQLDILFERLSGNLDGLLNQIEGTIPKADRASLLGGTVLLDFAREQQTLLIEKENTPLWRQLMDKSSFKGKQLGRDLELAEVSIDNLKTARSDLSVRFCLFGQSDNCVGKKHGASCCSIETMWPTSKLVSLVSIWQTTCSVQNMKWKRCRM